MQLLDLVRLRGHPARHEAGRRGDLLHRGLRTRARNALLTEAIAQEERVETAQDLLSLEGMTPELVAKLAQANVNTRDDLAELATDELAEMAGIDESAASQFIMAARAHWFENQ